MALSLNKSLACIEGQCRKAWQQLQKENQGTLGYKLALCRYTNLRDKVREQKGIPDWTPDVSRRMRLERDKRKVEPIVPPPPQNSPVV